MPDIVITPNRDFAETGIPTIQFSGVSGNSLINLEVLQDGTVAFIGSAGGLFSISDSLTGSLMAVSDMAGLPILEVFDSDKVVMGAFSSNALVVSGSGVAIGTDRIPDNRILYVSGDIEYLNSIYSGGVNINNIYAFKSEVGATGSNLNNKINAVSGYSYPASNPSGYTSASDFYPLNNPSGYVGSGQQYAGYTFPYQTIITTPSSGVPYANGGWVMIASGNGNGVQSQNRYVINKTTYNGPLNYDNKTENIEFWVTHAPYGVGGTVTVMPRVDYNDNIIEEVVLDEPYFEDLAVWVKFTSGSTGTAGYESNVKSSDFRLINNPDFQFTEPTFDSAAVRVDTNGARNLDTISNAKLMHLSHGVTIGTGAGAVGLVSKLSGELSVVGSFGVGGLQYPSFFINSNNQATASTLYLGTKGNAVAGQKSAIIASGINSWSRSNLHFCLNNTADTSDAGINDSRMVIANDGNVGIGVDDPDTKLHIRKNSGGNFDSYHSRQVIVEASGEEVGIFLKSPRYNTGYLTFGTPFDGSTAGFAFDGVNRSLRFLVKNGIERMRIDSVGNVGIGTTTPTAPLDVVDSASAPSIRFGSAATQSYATNNCWYGDNIYFDGSSWRVIDAGYGSALRFAPGGAVEIITTNGSLAANGNFSPKYALTMSTAGNLGLSQSSPGYLLHLGSNSAAKPSSNVWTVVSDARVKTVITGYNKGLDAVCGLEPVIYEYNGKAGFSGQTGQNISIIAQDAMEYFPECISSYMAKLNDDDEEETELYNWDGHALTFALVNAVKELKQQNDELKSLISGLQETKVDK